MLHLHASEYNVFSYVFDGKPPEMKKQELAKRYILLLLFVLQVECIRIGSII